jgi:hypothetical protein
MVTRTVTIGNLHQTLDRGGHVPGSLPIEPDSIQRDSYRPIENAYRRRGDQRLEERRGFEVEDRVRVFVAVSALC